MEKIFNLQDLMVEQLRDLYSAQEQLIKGLGRIRDEATDPVLYNYIDDYRDYNEAGLMRLQQAFSELFVPSEGEQCETMNVMLKELSLLVKRCMDPEVLDALLITSLQHIIHYKIAGYGAICTYAKTLKLHDLAGVVHKNLEDEKMEDKKLAMLGEEHINARASAPDLMIRNLN